MHEVAIVQSLIEQVSEEVRRGGHRGRVTRLQLVIGRLSGVHADSIRFAFEMLGPGTIVEPAQLDIVEPRAECVCQACHARQPIEDLALRCPQCGSGEVRIEGGRELLLQTIEVEDEQC